MLKVSSLKVEFMKYDTIKSIKLQNVHQSNVIFKVKVTKHNGKTCIDVQPNRGFIRAGSSVSFIIKSSSNQKFQAKVLFTYSMVSDKPLQFSQQWQNCKQKNLFQHKIIQIKRLQDFEQQQKLEFQQNNKQKPKQQKRQSILDIKEQRKKALSLDQRKQLFSNKNTNTNSSSPSKSPINFKVTKIKSKQQFQKQEFIEQISVQKRIYSTEEMQEVIDDLHQAQRLHQHQRVVNTKLV